MTSLPNVFHYIQLKQLNQNYMENFITKEIEQLKLIFDNVVLDQNFTPDN